MQKPWFRKQNGYLYIITDRRKEGDWLFGVHMHRDDIERALGYHFKWDELGHDTQYLADSQVLHIKRNLDSTIKRGLTDFFPVTEHLPNGDKLLKNTSTSAAVQAAIAFVRQHAEGTTKNQFADLRDANSVGVSTTVSAAGTRNGYLGRMQPGTVVDIPQSMEYETPPMAGASAAAGFIAIYQAVLRMIGTNWHMPENMISGDASNNNMTSSLVAEQLAWEAEHALENSGLSAQLDDQRLLPRPPRHNAFEGLLQSSPEH